MLMTNILYNLGKATNNVREVSDRFHCSNTTRCQCQHSDWETSTSGDYDFANWRQLALMTHDVNSAADVLRGGIALQLTTVRANTCNAIVVTSHMATLGGITDVSVLRKCTAWLWEKQLCVYYSASEIYYCKLNRQGRVYWFP